MASGRVPNMERIFMGCVYPICCLYSILSRLSECFQRLLGAQASRSLKSAQRHLGSEVRACLSDKHSSGYKLTTLVVTKQPL